MNPASPARRPRVCAVSYLNTVPLVWGFLHDPGQRDSFELGFALPSECAAMLASGEAQIGLVPAIEVARQKLSYFRGTGIASEGPVRSILLISKVPFREIRTLAADSGSRTSVMLARILLAELHGAEPICIAQAPDLATMLDAADAALLIGDAALRIDPASVPFETLDLGDQWTRMTGLPMVFAAWAGREQMPREPYGDEFLASCRFGLAHMDEIVSTESARRGFPEALVRDYLTRRIVFEFTHRHYAGLELFWERAAALERLTVQGGISL